jgi:hypothetical protein
MQWTPERRIEVARNIAQVLNAEARGTIMSWRAAELSELILFVLSMPEALLRANEAKYAGYYVAA